MSFPTSASVPNALYAVRAGFWDDPEGPVLGLIAPLGHVGHFLTYEEAKAELDSIWLLREFARGEVRAYVGPEGAALLAEEWEQTRKGWRT